LTVQWFLVGRNDYWAGDWELGLPATMANPPGPDDRDIALEIFGRPARGAWCGPYRINGRLPFPLSWDEWTSVRTEGSRR
jgi:hypothetical protein